MRLFKYFFRQFSYKSIQEYVFQVSLRLVEGLGRWVEESHTEMELNILYIGFFLLCSSSFTRLKSGTLNMSSIIMNNILIILHSILYLPWTYGKTFAFSLGHMERHFFGHMERHYFGHMERHIS